MPKTQPVRLYIASSWRNLHYPNVVKIAKEFEQDGGPYNPPIDVYDFRNPPNGSGFSWSKVDPNWPHWDRQTYRTKLYSYEADTGFNNDMVALAQADATLMVGPCGRSAHLEMGYATGRGQATAIYLPESQEAELMYRMVNKILLTEDEIRQWLKGVQQQTVSSRMNGG